MKSQIRLTLPFLEGGTGWFVDRHGVHDVVWLDLNKCPNPVVTRFRLSA